MNEVTSAEPSRLTLWDALEATMNERFESDSLGSREDDFARAVCNFDEERDPLVAIEYVIGVLLDARDRIIEVNGGGENTRLYLPEHPLLPTHTPFRAASEVVGDAPRALVVPPARVARRGSKRVRQIADRDAAIKVLGKHFGYFGQKGGWVFDSNTGRRVCHGWSGLARRRRWFEAGLIAFDKVTRKYVVSLPDGPEPPLDVTSAPRAPETA